MALQIYFFVCVSVTRKRPFERHVPISMVDIKFIPHLLLVIFSSLDELSDRNKGGTFILVLDFREGFYPLWLRRHG